MRFKKLNKFVALTLASLMCLASPLSVLAEHYSGGTSVAGGGVSGSNHTFSDYGIKISLGNMMPAAEYSDLVKLNPDADLGQLENQMKVLGNIGRRQMWETNGGITFAGANGNFRAEALTALNPASAQRGPGILLQTTSAGAMGQDEAGNLNYIAWMMYHPQTGDSAVANVHSYNEQLYNLFFGADGKDKAASDPDGWLAEVEQVAKAQAPEIGDCATILNKLVDPRGGHTNTNFEYFTWSSFSPAGIGGWQGEPMMRVQWSNKGMLGACTILAIAVRQRAPGSQCANDYTQKLANWVSSGLAAESSLCVVFEAVTGLYAGGAVPVYATGPMCICYAWPGVSAEMWYAKDALRPDGVTECSGIDAALNVFSAQAAASAPSAPVSAAARRFYGRTYRGGVVGVSDPSAPTRTGHSLTAYAGTDLAGWSVHFPYYIDNWEIPDGDPIDPWGSFTWDLTPKGLIDKTPAEEISESSTIYNLNISQSGYNKNNYSTKWEPYVKSDGTDCNQIQIDVYHISQKLPDGTESTVYTRDQVKSGGKPIITPVDKVTVGTGILTNVPSIGTLKAGEKTQVTDAQLLDILKTGTGLTYTETVAGQLVVGGNPEGVRVTYAVFVTVWPGCKTPKPFTNEQQWYVEYRSEPGVYIYESDDPQGFAEIKCGYFDRDRGYAEPYEAMAGSPTTENLYFVSGGQEFVAQITYKYVTNKNTIRDFEQKYTTERCPGWYQPWEHTFTEETIDSINTWLTANTGSPIPGKNQSNPCPQCGTVHDNAGSVGSEKHVVESITGGVTGSDKPVPGNYYTEINLYATHWDWKAAAVSTHYEGDPPSPKCSGASAKTVSDKKDGEQGDPPTCGCGTSSSWTKVKATRYSGTVKFYHTDWNNNAACDQLTASIKFQQQYENFNYAQAQKVHVWRLEKSRVEGIDQLTMDGQDVIVAEIPEDELSQVIFNVAEKDTAIEGRMYYILHPEQSDNFVFRQTLKTRGCCHCFNHNAAEDLISSAENPNKMYEAAWVISDYLILQSSNSNHSLLYHEYSSLNSTSGTSGTWPICRIKVSGTDQTSRQDNGYTITTWTGGNQPVTGSDGSTDVETFYGWDKRGQPFKTDIISFNTSAAGGKANDLNGTMEKICENSETFYGGPVSANNKNSRGLAFGGYNGDYTGTTTDLAAGTCDLESVDKYSGKKGKNNAKKGDKKIYKTGYTHQTQGELVGGLTDSPQSWKSIPEPLMLVYNDIDVHDYDVHNGEKKFKNSSIFYHYIIGYKAGNIYDIDTANDYGIEGFQKKTTYSSGSNNINNIIIHNPVSAQYAKLIALPSELDQRTDRNPFIDKLNQDDGKCPGKAQSCKYAHVNCKYNGTRYHTDDCYAEVRTGGLATTPVTGSITTIMKPVVVGDKVQGSQTFTTSGARQVFTAPATGVYHIDIYGASGAPSSRGGTVGKGGRVYGDVSLNKGDTLYVYVGGQGSGKSGGTNGGGNGAGNGSGYGGGGGGYTRIDSGSTVIAVAGGGGGAGSTGGYGGNGGYPNGTVGGKQYGNPGQPGTQSRGGSGGSNYGGSGGAWIGGSNSTTAASGGGGGGAGYYGGGAGGNDYSRYKDVDDSGGGGGSSYISSTLKNSGHATGVRSGNGQATISWNIDDQTTILVPETSGNLTVGDGATPIGTAYRPQIFQAKTSGMYSIHLYGAAGGGNSKGQGSAGGYGGYVGGQVYLTAGQKVLVTTGGIGSNGTLNSRKTEYEWAYPSGCGLYGQTYWGETPEGSRCSNHTLQKTGRSRVVGGLASGGYNGGGHGGTAWSGGYGGGGATDIVLNFVNQTANQMGSYTGGGTVSGGKLQLSTSSAFYWGPRMDSKAGHIYRVDYYGENLDKATFDTFAYLPNGTIQQNNATKVHEFITANYAQIFYRVNNPARTAGQEFRVFGNSGVAIQEMWVVDMDDRVLVAAGGGGADDVGAASGTPGGANDGSGGDGGGENGGNGKRDGAAYSGNAGAKASGGYLPGVGGDAQSSDAGGAGAGWYGGTGGVGGNDGGGGGSSNWRKVANGVTKPGQNGGSGYAIFIEPGKGDVPLAYQLSCNEPHHAMNLNHHKMISGWQHAGGFICNGESCTFCTEGLDLYSPTGFVWTKTKLSQAYIIKHNGEYHLTYGNDRHCDQCDQDVTFDKYSLDDKTYRDCCWKATSYNAAAYSTVGATSGKYHYAFGDETCYEPCNDDEKHKVIKSDEFEGDATKKAGQFVVLDYDFEVYFPNIGDFYGNGALGIANTQYPEGHGYIDEMDTTIWLREKYLLFPFDVTYNGHTFLAGEKVMLGWYDETNHIWHDDRPDDYRYTFHCLLDNLEAACARVSMCAIAKNSPFPDIIENDKEDHNYTRYGEVKRAYHDAIKNYIIDVIGRIGVLSIEDTGDFRFSNYYKQAIEGWRVNQVVREVDLGKQNFVSVDQKTIFNDPVSNSTKGQNTWGLLDWMEPVDKLRAFPLTPGENNVKALKNQAHRIGYLDYMSLVTAGNYYGENPDGSDFYKVQIQPYYYYYNLKTKEWVPVDVYVKTGNTYKIINDYGTTSSVAGPDGYNFYYDLNWEDENVRRMYTAEERNATENVGNNYTQAVINKADDIAKGKNVRIPMGVRWLHGTANMLFLRDGNRTFIGSRYRYGVNTEPDGRISEVKFQRQGQRHNFTLGLPTQSAFVQKDEPCTPENIAKYDMDNGIIVVALDIIAKGTVWTLEYDGTPVSDREFDLFNDGSQIVSWKTAGPNGPEDKIVVLVYTDAKTSRNDLTTEGTH